MDSVQTEPSSTQALSKPVTLGMVLLGLGLVLLGLLLGLRSFAADVSSITGEVRQADCGSVFLSTTGVRDLLSSPFFSGAEGCDVVLGWALLGVLASLAVGVLLLTMGGIRHLNASRGESRKSR